jgi:hypothetical protein
MHAIDIGEMRRPIGNVLERSNVGEAMRPFGAVALQWRERAACEYQQFAVVVVVVGC